MERYDDLIMNVEQGQGPSVGNDIVVEDVTVDAADETVHDQLPSVEEAKANLPRHSGKKFQKKLLVIAGVFLAVVGIVVGVAASAGNKPQEVTLTAHGEEIVRFLFEEQVTSLPALKDPAFPQHKAAMFIADGDGYHMDHIAETSRFLERFVLAVIYYHFGGPTWNYDLNFLSAQDHCEWGQNFETPAGRTIRMGVTCNADGYITKLNLSQNDLKGQSIPSEIEVMKHLETLHLYFNTITGEIPEAFRNMKSLKSIGLMQTGLGGRIPEWIGEMTQLTTLGLGNNAFNGELPQSFSQLRQMRILGLDDNTLSGNLNLFKGMSNLEALYLENNVFTGQLPDSANSWPSLVELDISNNMIDEKLPATLINHKRLAVLDLHHNMLSGAFPDDIFENTNLKVLALHENQLQGTIPDRVAFLAKLQHLDISKNRLQGTIPDDVSQLTDLRYWATSNNGFSEQPLPDLSKMNKLMDISMKGNNLVGQVPDWIGGLSHLEMLDLDGNQLSGSIPSWFGLLTGLNHLLLNRNKLQGTIPPQLANLKHLDVLLLDGNNISGNADVICEADHSAPTYFTSDCYPGQNGQRPEIECRCCTTCCIDGDSSCNNHDWSSNVDPVWEYGFLRPNYRFSLANAPAEYSKDPNAAVTDPLDDAFEN